MRIIIRHLKPIIMLVFICSAYSIFRINFMTRRSDTVLTEPMINPTSFSILRCEPFFKDPKQYKVEIDGEIYPKSVPIHYNSSIDFACLNRNKGRPLILYWNKFWTFYHKYDKNAKKNFCPVTNCDTTEDKSRWNESSLVVVHPHYRGSLKLSEFPKYRPDSLRTVFYYQESPVQFNLEPFYKEFENFFNLTATYRHDSDFPHYYDQAFGEWKQNPNFNREYDFHGQREKFAVALIGNCIDKSRRLELVEGLRKHVTVDVYGNNRMGGCSNKTSDYRRCPQTFKNGTKGECRTILAEEYKFFLVFENSICEDYITEKLFDTLKFNTIPVVYGGGEYDRYVPKSGYLDTRDFKTVQQLADRMRFLSQNKMAYNEFFKWKEHVSFNRNVFISPICHMCIQLNLEQYLGVKQSVISDLGDYWSPEKNCKRTNLSPVF